MSVSGGHQEAEVIQGLKVLYALNSYEGPLLAFSTGSYQDMLVVPQVVHQVVCVPTKLSTVL